MKKDNAKKDDKHTLGEYIVHVIAITIISVIITWGVTEFHPASHIMQVVADVDDTEFSDLYMHSTHYSAQKRNSNIVIADISQCNRRDIATFLTKLKDTEVAVIGLDVQFRYPEAEDTILIKIIRSLDNIVMPTHDGSYFDSLLTNTTFGDARLDVRHQYDVVRTMRFNSKDNPSLPTFAAAIAQKYSKHNLHLPDKESTFIYFDSLELGNQHRTLPVEKYISGDSIKDIVKNKIVLIGDIKAPMDFHRTPINAQMPGVLIHAYSIDTLLSKHFISQSGKALTWLISIFICAVFSIFTIWLKFKNGAVSDYREGLFLRLTQLAMMLIFSGLGLLAFHCGSYYFDFSHLLLMLALQAVALDTWLGLYSIIMRKRIEKRAKLSMTILFLAIGGVCFAQNDYSVQYVEGDVQLFRTHSDDSSKRWESARTNTHIASWDSIKVAAVSEIELEDELGFLYNCKGYYYGNVYRAVRADKEKHNSVFVQMYKDIVANVIGENNRIQQQKISAEITRDIDPSDRPSISDTVAAIVRHSASLIISNHILPIDNRMVLECITSNEGISHFKIINHDTIPYYVNVLSVNTLTGKIKLMYVLPPMTQEAPLVVLEKGNIDMSMFPFRKKEENVYLLFAVKWPYNPSTVDMLLSLEDTESDSIPSCEYILTH